MSVVALGEDDAEVVKKLEHAACEHGVVMDLLSVIES